MNNAATATESDKNILWKKTEAAAYLQVTVRHLEKWMRRGLPHRKLGPKCVRIDPQELKDFFAKQCKVIRRNAS
jgi:excisionase family DNA binding protein